MRKFVRLKESTWRNSPSTELEKTLEEACTRLSELDAWPFPNVVVDIVNEGDWDARRKEASSVRAMGVETDVGAFSMLRNAFGVAKPPSILCSGELFVATGLASDLLKDKLPREWIAIHFLAHETHHLTETARRSKAKVPAGLEQSRMAGGIVPELPSEWISIAVAAAAAEVAGGAKDLALRRAADIADEGAADAVGLYWLSRTTGGDWRRYAKSLAARRLEYERLSESNYAIGDAIDKFAGQNMPATLSGVYERVWAMVKEAGEGAADKQLASGFAALPALSLPDMQADRYSAKPRWGPR
jgi:hypothetical protein